MSEDNFLRYCIEHSQSERAGFMKGQIERLHRLAGEPIPEGLRERQIYTWRGAGIMAKRIQDSRRGTPQ